MKKFFGLLFVLLMLLATTGHQNVHAATDDSLARIQKKGTLVMGNSRITHLMNFK